MFQREEERETDKIVRETSWTRKNDTKQKLCLNWIGTARLDERPFNVIVRQGSRAADEWSLCSLADHNKASDHEYDSLDWRWKSRKQRPRGGRVHRGGESSRTRDGGTNLLQIDPWSSFEKASQEIFSTHHREESRELAALKVRSPSSVLGT